MKNTTKNKGIENNNEPVKDKYRIVGPLYDFLSNLYSGRSIHHCKIAMINKDNVKKGDRVLFAGVGHGLDAIQ
ncbi:MAG: SAM-dependent methyltransferase, partial [Betaproteobacteria bacterium HGW-Betaproteobacteria-18]